MTFKGTFVIRQPEYIWNFYLALLLVRTTFAFLMLHFSGRLWKKKPVCLGTVKVAKCQTCPIAISRHDKAMQCKSDVPWTFQSPKRVSKSQVKSSEEPVVKAYPNPLNGFIPDINTSNISQWLLKWPSFQKAAISVSVTPTRELVKGRKCQKGLLCY